MGKIVPAIKVLPRKKMIGRRIVNKILQDATGQEIDFPDVGENDTVSIESKAMIDNKPVTGEFVMPDASIYVFAAGVLKKITAPSDDAFAFAMRDRAASARKYLFNKKKVNPTATPSNRFAGILERYKNLKRK